MSKLGDEPAYPRWDLKQEEQCPGLTKRELFAAMAMQGMYAATQRNNNDGSMNWPNEAACAKWSRQQADALLAELAKENEHE